MDRITFQTNDGLRLEGEIHRPDVETLGAAVVCHAHPMHGGSKDHPVLWALRIELVRQGFVVVAFNFRGIMGSEGEFGGGEAEVADAEAAVGVAVREVPGPVFVAGWSFGGHVTLRLAAGDHRVGGAAMLGFPVAPDRAIRLPPLPSADDLAALQTPVLFVSGDRDPFSPIEELRTLARTLPKGSVAVLKGTGHFFPKREHDGARIVAEFARRRAMAWNREVPGA